MKKKNRKFFKILLILVIIFLCYIKFENEESLENIVNDSNLLIENTHITQNENPLIENIEDVTEEDFTSTQKILNKMNLKEKIGQLFIIRPESLDKDLTDEQVHSTNSYGLTKWKKEINLMLEEYPVGGFVLFGKNIENPSQIKFFITDLQEHSKLPLFIGIDEEGGMVSRIANDNDFDVIKYDNMEIIGNTKNEKEAYNVGREIGSYLSKYGFNLNFAPVADVNTNPDNIIIGKRAFGSDPELVASMVVAEIEGLHESGVINSIKHFPGHGDTKDDTHSGYVSIQKTWDELYNCELVPFLKSFETTDMVMVAHITANNITNDDLPASLSYEMITEKLRNELNYDKVIITDSLAMGAITQNYTSEESAVIALKAGIDILLMPNDYIASFEAIYKAVQEGEISEERIDDSVKRILDLKIKYGLIKE